MTKYDHINTLRQIEEELYRFIDNDEVEKYYVPTIELCRRLLEEGGDK